MAAKTTSIDDASVRAVLGVSVREIEQIASICYSYGLDISLARAGSELRISHPLPSDDIRLDQHLAEEE